MSAEATAYDDLPYEDLAFFHTHPSNLAVVAALCGLEPPQVENCRVLELGCGTGFNLLAMSQSLPGATFVGVDLSARQIDRGRATAAAVGIENVTLHAMDVCDIGDSFGTFEYVIAHGLFSWVPAPVRDEVLALCDKLLTPNGLAYVSYNAYPGWHQRGILRDVMYLHDSPNLPPAERVRLAREGAEKTLASLPDPDSPYGRLLRKEVEALRGFSDVHVFHDHLSPDNQPFRLDEFAATASKHGLRYLAESRYGTNGFAQDRQTQQALAAFSGDFLRREQHLDYLRNRFFRQSILCREGSMPTYSPAPAALMSLRVRCRAESVAVGADENGNETERIRLDGETVIATADPILRAMLHAMGRKWPRPVSVAELLDAVAAAVADVGFPAGFPVHLVVASHVARGYADGLWEMFAYDPPFAAVAGERPLACPLARHVAERSAEVVNRLHRAVTLADADRAVLRLLDGAMTRGQLAVTLSHDADAVDNALRSLAASALLTG